MVRRLQEEKIKIHYVNSVDNITPENLKEFFVGWPKPPAPETHLRILRGSDKVALALEGESVVGFITALSDGVLTAFIPLLEVLPEYKGKGIGRELVRRMLDELKELYSVDLICDAGLQSYYERLGMRRTTGMLVRNYERQSGA